MISRTLLATAPIVAIANDAGPLELVKNALLLVFLAVGSAWLFIDIRRNLAEAYGDPAPAPVAAPPPTAASIPETLPGQVVAAIAAAVHHSLGATSRVVAISSLDDDTGQTWAAEGRRAIYATRKLR